MTTTAIVAPTAAPTLPSSPVSPAGLGFEVIAGLDDGFKIVEVLGTGSKVVEGVGYMALKHTRIIHIKRNCTF